MVLVFILFALSGAGMASAKPRVVSLDSCADQYVLALADDDQIMALSRNAHMPFSHLRERAMAFGVHDGRVESLLAFKPDIAVATGMADGTVVEVLRRVGVPVMSSGLSMNVADSGKDILFFGKALDQNDKALHMLQAFEARLAMLQSQPMGKKTALYLSPGGTTSGAGTFIDELIVLGGYKNFMTEQGLKGWAQMNVERLVQQKPDVIIGGFFDARLGAADAWRFSSHPVIDRLMKASPMLKLPSHLISCPAWFSLDAAEMIRKDYAHGQ